MKEEKDDLNEQENDLKNSNENHKVLSERTNEKELEPLNNANGEDHDQKENDNEKAEKVNEEQEVFVHFSIREEIEIKEQIIEEIEYHVEEIEQFGEEQTEKSEEKKKKIIIIDNYPIGFPTDRIIRLETILNSMIADITVETIHFSDLNDKNLEHSSGYILSGSSYNVSDFYFNYKLKKKFEPEINLILNQGTPPILGICFGHQLIAYAFGAQICRMRIPGLDGNIIFIKLNETDEIINKKNIVVNTHHRDFIHPNDSKLMENFNIISTSKTKDYKIIQYMRHVNRPIYSIQFHPETHHGYYFNPNLFDERIVARTRMIGENILENFVWRCIYEKKAKHSFEKRESMID